MPSKTSVPVATPWELLSLLFLISIQVARWIWLSLNESRSLYELQQSFLRIYPPFLREAQVVTWVNFSLACACLVWCIRLLAYATERRLYWLLLVWSALLVLWLGFSLM